MTDDDQLRSEARQDLERYDRARRESTRLLQIAADLRGRAQLLAGSTQEQRVQAQPDPTRAEALLCRALDLERKCGAAAQDAETILRRIEAVHDIRMRCVLTRRWVRCEPWREIAAAERYSLRQVHRLCDAGLLEYGQNLRAERAGKD